MIVFSWLFDCLLKYQVVPRLQILKHRLQDWLLAWQPSRRPVRTPPVMLSQRVMFLVEGAKHPLVGFLIYMRTTQTYTHALSVYITTLDSYYILGLQAKDETRGSWSHRNPKTRHNSTLVHIGISILAKENILSLM